MERTVYFTPSGWPPGHGVAVAKVSTPGGPWRVCIPDVPDDMTPDEAESVAACLFQAAAEARQLEKVEAAKGG
jgi:hypothetical protein